MAVSLSLSMITNDAESTKKIINDYGKYFDKYFITVADKKKDTYYALKELKDDKLNLTYFKWEDHFGKAREFNRQQIDTEYFFWVDSDDEIINPENIRPLAERARQQGLDAIYVLYNYVQNERQEGIGDHWRERIVRTDHFTWAQTRVHETLIAPNAATSRTDELVVLHHKTIEDQEKSMERNIKLLLQDFEETQDPRIAMYLGDNLLYLGMKEEALKYLFFLIDKGGWDEDKYRAWLRVSEIYTSLDEHEKALNACFEAEKLRPDFPDAYFLKAMVYNALQQPQKVYEWVKVGMMKPAPETLSVVDPTLYEYRGIFMGALAALELGKIDEAYKLCQIVRKRSPDYELAKKMEPLFEEAYYDNKAIDQIKWLIFYLKDNGGNPERLMNALPSKIFADPRMNAIRSQLYPPKKWNKDSIVYYCGPAAETWGPDTLDKGMGGSEEAVVYLSREWVKLGKDVIVYNDREEEYVDHIPGATNPVTYRPWTLLNPNDEFDIFIAWRAPENIRGVKARKKFVDLHDTVEAERVYSVAKLEPEAKFFVKSKYHRDLYPELEDDRFVIVGNGIQKEHFV